MNDELVKKNINYENDMNINVNCQCNCNKYFYNNEKIR